MSEGIIYCIHCLVSGKKYIGQTIQSFEKRIYGHLKDYKNYDTKFYRYVKKYGWNNFIWGIIEECEREKLNEREIYWIEYFDSYKKGFNSTKGGESSPSRKNKVIKFEIESPEGIIYKTENLNQFCKQHNLRAGDICRVIHKQILSINGWKLPSTKIVGDETKAVPYSFIDPEGKIHTGFNVSRISKENNLSISKMSEVLKGKRKSYKGWTKNPLYDTMNIAREL